MSLPSEPSNASTTPQKAGPLDAIVRDIRSKIIGGLLAALPFITAAALAVANPDYIVLLLTDHTGQKVLGAAFAMLGMGMAVMKFMIKKSLG